MLLTNEEVKSVIRSRWDVSSQDYDTHDGHGIKTQEERYAWKNVLIEALPKSNLDILDVGCGTGELSLVLAEMGHNVTGVDLSERMLSKARAKARSSRLKARFVAGDAEKLKFEDQRFDAIVNRHLLWTLPNPKRAFSEWNRVLKLGGSLLVIDGEWRNKTKDGRLRRRFSEMMIFLIERKNPWKNNYFSEIQNTLPHPFGLTCQDAKKYFQDAGLANVTCSDLSEIRELQKTTMPFHRRISFCWTYYLVKGIKNRSTKNGRAPN